MVFGKRDQPYFDGVIESFIDNKMEYELYNPDELKIKFTNLTMASDEWGCYDPAGGVLLADKCLRSVWVCVLVLVRIRTCSGFLMFWRFKLRLKAIKMFGNSEIWQIFGPFWAERTM